MFSPIALLLLAASSVTAAPATQSMPKELSDLIAAGKAFRLPHTKHENFVRNGTAATKWAISKYATARARIHGDSSLQGRASTGKIAATPEAYQSEYLVTLQIGTPPLSIALDLDTGSADLWVFSSELSAANQRGHTIYNPAKSTTSSKYTGESWQITYGDGSSASGDVYKDTVSAGGVTFSKQAVENARTVSSGFAADQSNGLLGLALGSINTCSPQLCTTFFDNVKSSLAAPLFTANLKTDSSGQYDFGYLDNTQYTGTITYTPVNTQNGFWEINASGYAIGTNGFVNAAYDSIVDTGTTLMYLPNIIVSKYYSRVSGAQNSNTYGGFVFPCSATLPSITIGIGSYRAVVPGKYINYAPVDSTGRTCYGGIQSNSGIGFTILGDVFIKSQYIVFDNTGGNYRIGAAAKPL